MAPRTTPAGPVALKTGPDGHMLFADIAIAARIELAECPPAGRLRRGRGGARTRGPSPGSSAGGVATYTGPDSPFNKLAGFGDAILVRP